MRRRRPAPASDPPIGQEPTSPRWPTRRSAKPAERVPQPAAPQTQPARGSADPPPSGGSARSWRERPGKPNASAASRSAALRRAAIFTGVGLAAFGGPVVVRAGGFGARARSPGGHQRHRGREAAGTTPVPRTRPPVGNASMTVCPRPTRRCRRPPARTTRSPLPRALPACETRNRSPTTRWRCTSSSTPASSRTTGRVRRGRGQPVIDASHAAGERFERTPSWHLGHAATGRRPRGDGLEQGRSTARTGCHRRPGRSDRRGFLEAFQCTSNAPGAEGGRAAAAEALRTPSTRRPRR